MRPSFKNGIISSLCPNCDVVTTFEMQEEGKEFGSIVRERNVSAYVGGKKYRREIYKLVRCSGCHRGGLAVFLDNGQLNSGVLLTLYPFGIDKAKLPEDVPKGIVNEYREAELCASANALRAASAMLRSALEKTLIANGYTKGNLKSRINEASVDGIITDSRCKKAHEDVRVLGNDILHDEWRDINVEEYDSSHHYVQRILEDFYDDRETVVKLLESKKRINK